MQELLESRDSFDALSSKWKLPILQYLYNRIDETNNFRKISRGVAGISDKMLSKELKHLEENYLISKSEDLRASRRVYHITEHGTTAIPLIKNLVAWGRTHRDFAKQMFKDAH